MGKQGERERERPITPISSGLCIERLLTFKHNMSSAAAPHVANDGELGISGVQRLKRQLRRVGHACLFVSARLLPCWRRVARMVYGA